MTQFNLFEPVPSLKQTLRATPALLNTSWKARPCVQQGRASSLAFDIDFIEHPVAKNLVTFLLLHRERLLQDAEVNYVSKPNSFEYSGQIINEAEYLAATSDGFPDAEEVRRSFQYQFMYEPRSLDWMTDQIVWILSSGKAAYKKWVKQYEGWDEDSKSAVYEWSTGLPVGQKANNWRPVSILFTHTKRSNRDSYKDASVLQALSIISNEYDPHSVDWRKCKVWDEVLSVLLSDEEKKRFIEIYHIDDQGRGRYHWDLTGYETARH